MFQQRITPGLAGTEVALRPELPLLAALIAEVEQVSTAEQAHGFFRAVGARIAARLPLATIDDADELATRINALWDGLGWGRVAFAFDDDGIEVQHRGLPPLLAGEEAKAWVQAAPHVLAGAYDSWFRDLGSGEHLVTRIVSVTGDVIALRHGY